MARNGNDGNPLRIVDMGGIIGAARRFRNSLIPKPGTTIDGIGPENFPSAGQPVSPLRRATPSR